MCVSLFSRTGDQPHNTSSLCWIRCFFDTVLGPNSGNTTNATGGMPLTDLEQAWLKPFKPVRVPIAPISTCWHSHWRHAYTRGFELRVQPTSLRAQSCIHVMWRAVCRSAKVAVRRGPTLPRLPSPTLRHLHVACRCNQEGKIILSRDHEGTRAWALQRDRHPTCC